MALVCQIAQAVRVAPEIEREGVEGTRRPHPDELVGAPVDRGAELLAPPLANAAVESVRSDDERMTLGTLAGEA